MDGKQLKAIRKRMGLTQKALADRLRVAENTVARMERNEQAITPPMELLIGYVTREPGVDLENSNARSGRRDLAPKAARSAGLRHSAAKSRRRPR